MESDFDTERSRDVGLAGFLVNLSAKAALRLGGEGSATRMPDRMPKHRQAIQHADEAGIIAAANGRPRQEPEPTSHQRAAREPVSGDLINEMHHALALIFLQFVSVGALRPDGLQRIARAVVGVTNTKLYQRHVLEGMG